MNQLIEFLRKRSLYEIFLHIAVVVLAAQVLILAKQNRELKSGGEKIAALKRGDYLSLANLEPLQTEPAIDSTARQLLFVFTTTCPFCKENLSQWAHIAEQVKGKNISIQGLSIDAKDKTMQYAKEHGLNFPIYCARDIKTFRTQNKISGVPTTVVRSGAGRVEQAWAGLLSDDNVLEVIHAASGSLQASINQINHH